ncbi:MAG: TlpA family protein disulfide reductase [Cyclobacteriaceae bacterium]
MRKAWLYGLIIISFTISYSQDVKVRNYDELEKEMKANENEVLLVNFWATWCGPCIKELPHFEAANKRNDVRVLLVSVDFPQEFQKVKKFVGKKQLSSEVFLLNEIDYDSYMSRVSEKWSGALPATLLIDKDGNREFYERSFDEKELNQLIQSAL